MIIRSLLPERWTSARDVRQRLALLDDDGDITKSGWRIPNPGFAVNPDDEGVWGWEWPADTELTITVVGKGSFTVDTDENGNFGTGAPGIDIEVDDVVQVTDGVTTKDHTVLWFTYNVDEGMDTVSGTAPEDSWVRVWARDNDSEYGTEVQADSGGNWSFYFNDNDFYVDIKPGTEGNVGRYDEDGDGTEFSWRIPNPSIAVNPENDTVWGWEWLANTEVTLTINDGVPFNTDTNEKGEFGFNDLGVDVVTGDEVNVSGGGASKDHTVMELHDISYSELDDTVSGIATENEWVNVWACDYDNCNGIDWEAGTGGAFSVDMTQIGIDIAPGTNGNVGRWDEDGDGTVIDWRVPNPTFSVNPDNNNVWGDEWPGETEITLTIGTFTHTVTSQGDGHVEFGEIPLDLGVGDYLVVTDGVKTKEHEIMPFAITDVNEEFDTVTGTAPGNTWVDAWACDNNHCEGNGVESGVGGDWEVDLSDRWDIVKGTNGSARAVDEDGDGTQLDWRIPNPGFAVNPEQDHVYGWDWPVDTDITLTFGSLSWMQRSDENGNVDFSDLETDFQVDDYLEMSGGGKTKDTTVFLLTIDEVDPDTNIVSGTSEAGFAPWTWVCKDGDCQGQEATEDGAGNWTSDFTAIKDIVPGSDGGAWRDDGDGDGTEIHWRVARPVFTVNLSHMYVWGGDWTPGSTATLNVRGADVATTTVESDGQLSLDTSPFNIVPGDTVTLRDPNAEKSLLVRNLTLDNVDLETEIVNGTADSGSVISVWADNVSCPDGVNPSIETTTVSGVWEVDFSTISCDIYPGSTVFVNLNEDDGDYTEVRWDVPNPRIEVNPFLNRVKVRELLPDTDVTLTIGTYHDTLTTDQDGYVEFNTSPAFFDIVPGQVVVVTDGTNTRTHTRDQYRGHRL